MNTGVICHHYCHLLQVLPTDMERRDDLRKRDSYNNLKQSTSCIFSAEVELETACINNKSTLRNQNILHLSSHSPAESFPAEKRHWF